LAIDGLVTDPGAQSISTAAEIMASQHTLLRPPLIRAVDDVDIPTLWVASAVYLGYGVLTWFFRDGRP
jgi:hypothetical protein